MLFQIPVIEEKAVDAYLAQFDKKLDEKAVSMNKERFLLGARTVVCSCTLLCRNEKINYT